MYENVLLDWNFWGRFDIDYIEREVDISQLVDRKFALILFGVRRAGKSYIAYGFLKKQKDLRETLIINFEDPRIRDIDAKECINILEEYLKLTDAKDPIIVLDEVQNVKGWESFVRYLLESKRYRVVVTGSSSKLMSKEYATSLTGRHIDIEIFPLSFSEFLRFKGMNVRDKIDVLSQKPKIIRFLEEYLEYGSFPAIALETGDTKRTELLRQYFEDTLSKDIIRRFNIRDESFLRKLSNVYLSNIGNVVKFRKIAREFNKSVSTVERYSHYMEIARMFLFLNKLSYKSKEVEKSFKKVYVIDVGFHNKLGLKFSRNFGRVVENVVFTHLVRKHRPNRELFYYITRNGKEVDFAVKDGKRITALIEVCAEDYEDHGRKLLAAGEELNCRNLLVITWDYEDTREIRWFGRSGKIRFVPLWKWLLGIG